jgi:hypothetical protein
MRRHLFVILSSGALTCCAFSTAENQQQAAVCLRDALRTSGWVENAQISGYRVTFRYKRIDGTTSNEQLEILGDWNSPKGAVQFTDTLVFPDSARMAEMLKVKCPFAREVVIVT